MIKTQLCLLLGGVGVDFTGKIHPIIVPGRVIPLESQQLLCYFFGLLLYYDYEYREMKRR